MLNFSIDQAPERLTAEDIGRLVGTTARTIRRWTKLGQMPQPVRLPTGRLRWRKDDIQRWLAEKIPAFR